MRNSIDNRGEAECCDGSNFGFEARVTPKIQLKVSTYFNSRQISFPLNAD